MDGLLLFITCYFSLYVKNNIFLNGRLLASVKRIVAHISRSKNMKVYGWNIPDNKGLTNLELDGYAKILGIENFRGVYMRDVLPKILHHKECGIVNL